MIAARAFGPKDIRMVELPDPTPGEGQVLLAARASGICGSDKWLWRLEKASEYVGGHEVAGEVMAIGLGVKRLRVGDRVAVNNVIGCGHCRACRAGDFVRCPQRPGYDVDNGFAELLVAPERNCLLLADGLSYEAGCLLFDNWGTPYNALKCAGVGPADDVVVSGCGPIGLGAVSLAKLLGAYVIAVDPQPYRRAAAQRLGADEVLSPDDGVLSAIKGFMGGVGASVVVECSGKAPAYSMGLSVLRIGGKFVAVGEGARVDLSPSDLLIRNHLTLLGSWYSSMRDGAELQALMAAGRIGPSAFVTHRATFAELPAAFARACEFTDDVLKTVILS